ncbi:MAG: NUDIX domain-containing protein [Salinivirgaceae bacterium]|jgi:8-oxo-dGTP diphosphatase|nr:NUDIX domain-containing protein [Salinivirgaceae bacterium]
MHTTNIIKPLSVDSVIFGFEDDQLKVLLIKRIVDKDSGTWALPGGYIKYDEDIDVAAARILEERTGVKVFMKQLGAFGEVNRFPDKRIITIAYYALVKPRNFALSLEDDASAIEWVNVYDLPKLLFDHGIIIEHALRSLRRRVRIEPIGFNLLPNSFPLLSLQRLYESILNTTFDKPNFRRKILKMKLLIPLEEKQEGVAHRSARLFKFDKNRYDKLIDKGFSFEV